MQQPIQYVSYAYLYLVDMDLQDAISLNYLNAAEALI